MKNNELKVYNTLSRQKELFEPINPPYVGMYVCGPTVYNYVHLGNCRTFTSFDVVYRYLTHLGYKVRYVRNITDVGHLTDDTAESGEDKISKRAKLENLEPMEIVQKYTNDFHAIMQMLNNTSPSIEPTATGHIVEQIEITQNLIEKGLAYVSNGSVYFDVNKYHEQGKNYGKLSGRVIEELMAGYRDLDGQDEKRNPVDFALWKKANPEHIMRWNSPWGEGFPGWHIECSVMSTKYLGKTFDIHGGGMDLKFPHHECEIAQGTAANDCEPVHYWLHANMLTMNGQKMSKSVGNVILPHELFTGNHELLAQAYTPMTLRFCMLQTHYSSTMDITNDALKSAEKAYRKIVNGLRIARKIATEVHTPENLNEKAIQEIFKAQEAVYAGMNDDFNTAKAIAALFELLKKHNLIYNGNLKISELSTEALEVLTSWYIDFVETVLGLLEEKPDTSGLVDFLVATYKDAKAAKDYAKVDSLRAEAKKFGVVFRDMKDRIDWAYDEA